MWFPCRKKRLITSKLHGSVSCKICDFSIANLTAMISGDRLGSFKQQNDIC